MCARAGFKQDGAKVLEYVRWVMVRKRDEAAAAPGDLVPELPTALDARAARRRLPDDRDRAPTTSRSPAARIASATIRSARRSTTSTA